MDAIIIFLDWILALEFTIRSILFWLAIGYSYAFHDQSKLHRVSGPSRCNSVLYRPSVKSIKNRVSNVGDFTSLDSYHKVVQLRL